uniref:Uncharacterized protein n=1 Tax=Anguilla anguilla TaxID=7936 RepID=A0A0E9U6P6_ANGAN
MKYEISCESSELVIIKKQVLFLLR